MFIAFEENIVNWFNNKLIFYYFKNNRDENWILDSIHKKNKSDLINKTNKIYSAFKQFGFI